MNLLLEKINRRYEGSPTVAGTILLSKLIVDEQKGSIEIFHIMKICHAQVRKPIS